MWLALNLLPVKGIPLAKNLETSNARFISELLQNSDSDQHTHTRQFGQAPQLPFHVYSHHIVIECNEDGFTHENLIAIDNVGKSSKNGANDTSERRALG